MNRLSKRRKSQLIKFIEYALELNDLPWESSDVEIQKKIDKIKNNATNTFLNQKGLQYEE